MASARLQAHDLPAAPPTLFEGHFSPALNLALFCDRARTLGARVASEDGAAQAAGRLLFVMR